MYRQGTSKPVGGMGEGPVKVMSNADRRRMGLEQDESLTDFDVNYRSIS
jgi:hypothetical protein